MTKLDTRKIVLVILFISILLVISLIVGKITYSYLAPTISDDATMKGEVTASGDTIMFTSGNTLSLSATTDNFKTNGSNLTSTTNPKAKLVASSKTNSATSNYYVGVYIKNNTYNYSTSNNTPEIILTIKDENGNNVTSVTGLSYVTQGGVSGFDVTNKSGLFDIKTNYPISTTSSTTGTTHTWTFTLTFVNLSTDQSLNENGEMDIEIYLQRKAFPSTIGDVCNNGKTLSSCVVKLYNEDKLKFSNLYYHDSSLENGAGDNSYRYSGASTDVNNYVCFGSDEETCPNDNLYRIIGVFDDRVRLIKADYATSSMLGTDTSDYKGIYSNSTSYYQGENSNLTNIAGYYWNKVNYSASISETGCSNNWNYSELNKTHLNKNYISYLNNINTKWTGMIDTTTWKVGGNTDANMYQSNAKTAYTNEITSPSDQVTNTYESKVGLMYVSDYYYGSAPSYWTYPGYSSSGASYDYRAATKDNWMYMGLYEWTIARSASDLHGVYTVDIKGYVIYRNVDTGGAGVRPVFHLTPNINYISGAGTKTNPIRLG